MILYFHATVTDYQPLLNNTPEPLPPDTADTPAFIAPPRFLAEDELINIALTLRLARILPLSFFFTLLILDSFLLSAFLYA
jgi:hypothetical protein